MIDRSFYNKIQDLNWQDKLGNLASTLAKISTQATIPQQDRLTVKLLREAALIIEWNVRFINKYFHLSNLKIERKERSQRRWQIPTTKNVYTKKQLRKDWTL